MPIIITHIFGHYLVPSQDVFSHDNLQPRSQTSYKVIHSHSSWRAVDEKLHERTQTHPYHSPWVRVGQIKAQPLPIALLHRLVSVPISVLVPKIEIGREQRLQHYRSPKDAQRIVVINSRTPQRSAKTKPNYAVETSATISPHKLSAQSSQLDRSVNSH